MAIEERPPDVPLPATAVILAGGSSRRMGFDKALADFNGVPLALYVASRVSPWFSQVLVSSSRAGPFRGSGFAVVPDREEGLGVLGGLSSAMAAATFPWVFAMACDMPLLRRELVQSLWQLRHGFDAVVPENGGELEPLCAFYSVSCAPVLDGILGSERRVRALADRVNTFRAPESAWLHADPARLSFFNANTPTDLERARALASSIPESAGACPQGME